MASELVTKVRAKYGDTYKDFSDSDLEAAILAKHPEYADLASSQAKMGLAANRSMAGAEAGQQARSEAIDPTSMLQNMGQAATIDSESLPAQAKGSAVGGALGLAAIGAPTTLPAAGRMALGMAGAEVGSRYGTPLATRLGLPPEVGAIGGGLLGAIAPEAALTRLAGRTAVNAALSARIAHTLTREAPAAVEAAGEAAVASRMAPGASQAARALEGAGLSPELATAEAGKMASATGEVSGNLPGVMTPARGTPALKMPAVAWSQDIQSQVATLRAAGESKAQIIQTLRETYGHKNLPADATEKIVDMIFETGSRVPATAEALPAGSKLAPPYRGGKGLPYTGTPPPRNDAELNQRLRESLDAYKLP